MRCRINKVENKVIIVGHMTQRLKKASSSFIFFGILFFLWRIKREEPELGEWKGLLGNHTKLKKGL